MLVAPGPASRITVPLCQSARSSFPPGRHTLSPGPSWVSEALAGFLPLYVPCTVNNLHNCMQQLCSPQSFSSEPSLQSSFPSHSGLLLLKQSPLWQR